MMFPEYIILLQVLGGSPLLAFLFGHNVNDYYKKEWSCIDGCLGEDSMLMLEYILDAHDVEQCLV